MLKSVNFLELTATLGNFAKSLVRPSVEFSLDFFEGSKFDWPQSYIFLGKNYEFQIPLISYKESRGRIRPVPASSRLNLS